MPTGTKPESKSPPVRMTPWDWWIANAVLLPFILGGGPLVIFTCVAGAYEAQDLLGKIAVGAFCSAGVWAGGYLFALHVCESLDKALFPLTPITPGQYYGMNARRLRILLMCMYGIMPVVTAGGATLLMLSPAGTRLNVPLLLPLSLALLHYTALAVCLYERMYVHTNPTGVLFCLRLPFQRERNVLVSAGLIVVLLGADKLLFSIFAPTFDALRALAEWLLDAGFAGQFAVFLLSPASAMLLDPAYPAHPALLPAACALMLGCTAYCAYHIRAHVNAPGGAFEVLAPEDGEDAEAPVPSEESGVENPYHATPELDGQHASGGGETGEILAYRSDLSEEAQALRHYRQYTKAALNPSDFGWKQLHYLARNHYFLMMAAIAWGIGRSVPPVFWEVEGLGRDYAAVAIFYVWIVVSGFPNTRLEFFLSAAPLPLRWPTLLAQTAGVRAVYDLSNDLLVALMIVHLTGPDLKNYLLAFGCFFLLRCFGRICPLLNLFYAARRLWLHWLCMLGILAHVCVYIAIVGIRVANSPVGMLNVEADLPILIALCASLLAFAVILTLLSFARGGTSVLGDIRRPNPQVRFEDLL